MKINGVDSKYYINQLSKGRVDPNEIKRRYENDQAVKQRNADTRLRRNRAREHKTDIDDER